MLIPPSQVLLIVSSNKISILLKILVVILAFFLPPPSYSSPCDNGYCVQNQTIGYHQSDLYGVTTLDPISLLLQVCKDDMPNFEFTDFDYPSSINHFTHSKDYSCFGGDGYKTWRKVNTQTHKWIYKTTQSCPTNYTQFNDQCLVKVCSDGYYGDINKQPESVCDRPLPTFPDNCPSGSLDFSTAPDWPSCDLNIDGQPNEDQCSTINGVDYSTTFCPVTPDQVCPSGICQTGCGSFTIDSIEFFGCFGDIDQNDNGQMDSLETPDPTPDPTTPTPTPDPNNTDNNGGDNSGSGGDGSGTGEGNGSGSGGDGSGTGEGDNTETPTVPTLDDYEVTGDTIDKVLTDFSDQIKSAPIYTSVANTLAVNIPAGSCNAYNLDISYIQVSLSFDFHCSQTFIMYLTYAGYILMSGCIITAFYIAFT